MFCHFSLVPRLEIFGTVFPVFRISSWRGLRQRQLLPLPVIRWIKEGIKVYVACRNSEIIENCIPNTTYSKAVWKYASLRTAGWHWPRQGHPLASIWHIARKIKETSRRRERFCIYREYSSSVSRRKLCRDIILILEVQCSQMCQEFYWRY
jgi:hypothetical protein